jgi:hypothetical protein
MSLLMDDDDQYMEDLFGDSEQVHVPIAAAIPAVKGLAERLDELAGSGCCQYATSRMYLVLCFFVHVVTGKFHGRDLGA